MPWVRMRKPRYTVYSVSVCVIVCVSVCLSRLLATAAQGSLKCK